MRRLARYGLAFAAGQAFQIYMMARAEKLAREYAEAAIGGAVQGVRDFLRDWRE